jgi:ABC-2 type transport system permease protein
MTPAASPTRYHRIGQLSAQGILTDRAGMAYTGGHYLLVTTALSSLWATAGRVNGGSVAGYATTALVWYVATTEVTTITVPQRLIEQLGLDIVSGRIEAELLRPAPSLWVRLATELGAIVPRLALCAPLGLAFAVVVGGRPPDAVALALAAPAMVLGTAVNLLAQHLFAAGAFWLRETRSAWFLYQKLLFTLGGLLLPLEVLPSGIGRAARLTPFAAMAYVPARLASGHREPAWLAVQIGWLAVLALAANWAFAAGERHLLDGGS